MPSYKSHESMKGDYVKTEEVRADGGSVTVMIEKVISAVPEFDKDGKQQLIAHLNTEQMLTLNKGRCEDLEEITGSDDYDEWAGVWIQIYVDESIKYAGKKVGGMRISKGSPDQAADTEPPF